MIRNSDHEAIIGAGRGFWSDCPFALFSAAMLIRSCNSLRLNHLGARSWKASKNGGQYEILLRAPAHGVLLDMPIVVNRIG